MKKYLVLLLALFMVFTLHSQGYSAVVPVDGDEFSTTNFRIDSDGAVYYKARTEIMSTNDTVTAAESGKVFVISNGGGYAHVKIALPDADTGLNYTFIQQGSGTLVEIEPASDETLVYSTATAGDRLVGPATIGASAHIWASDDSVWFVEANGTFTIQLD